MRRAEKLTQLTDSKAELRAGTIRMLLAAALGLATLYMISKSGDTLGDTGRRVMTIALLAVGTYFALGFISVITVWTGAYRGWMAWFFSLAEVLLLCVALTVHVRASGADSSVALSSPAAFALAVVLVVQVLYQRPGLQIFISLVLIGATAFIVVSQVIPDGEFGDNAELFLQQNYTDIANAFRIFALFLIALLVGLAVIGGRRALNEVEAEAHKRIDVSRFVPDELLNQMKGEDFPPLDEGRVTDLVVMIVELRGFTALRKELGVEEASRMLDGFRERVSKSAARWNGVVERFTGDSAQVIFGLQGSAEAAARSAIDAALSLMDEVSVWNAERGGQSSTIRHVTAIHLGELLVGLFGGERRREFGAIGPAVSDTYRIASVAIQKNALLIASEPVLELSGIGTGGADWIDLEMGIQRADRDPVRLYGLNVQ